MSALPINRCKPGQTGCELCMCQVIKWATTIVCRTSFARLINVEKAISTVCLLHVTEDSISPTRHREGQLNANESRKLCSLQETVKEEVFYAIVQR